MKKVEAILTGNSPLGLLPALFPNPKIAGLPILRNFNGFQEGKDCVEGMDNIIKPVLEKHMQTFDPNDMRRLCPQSSVGEFEGAGHDPIGRDNIVKQSPGARCIGCDFVPGHQDLFGARWSHEGPEAGRIGRLGGTTANTGVA